METAGAGSALVVLDLTLVGRIPMSRGFLGWSEQLGGLRRAQTSLPLNAARLGCLMFGRVLNHHCAVNPLREPRSLNDLCGSRDESAREVIN